MAGLWAFLTMIPKLLDLAIRLGDQIKKHEFDRWLEQVDQGIKLLETAKSPEEKRGAALAISRIIANRSK